MTTTTQDPIELAREYLSGRSVKRADTSTLARAVLALAAERDELLRSWHCNDCGYSAQRTERRIEAATTALAAERDELRAEIKARNTKPQPAPHGEEE